MRRLCRVVFVSCVLVWLLLCLGVSGFGGRVGCQRMWYEAMGGGGF